jgi:Tfp pilus assembly protein PilF
VGLELYDRGRYGTALTALQNALSDGLSRRDQILAHKHLAFIHCISKREKLCRDEFQKALRLDPGFELDPAEAGHPMWGPAFRAVKAQQQQ